MDVSNGPESCTQHGYHVPSHSSRDLPHQRVDVGHGPSDGPRSAQASFGQDGTHLRWCSSCNLPTPGMDASNGPSNVPHSAPARYSSNLLPSHTSAFSTFPSTFDDDRRDLMHDTVAAASSSSAHLSSDGARSVQASFAEDARLRFKPDHLEPTSDTIQGKPSSPHINQEAVVSHIGTTSGEPVTYKISAQSSRSSYLFLADSPGPNEPFSLPFRPSLYPTATYDENAMPRRYKLISFNSILSALNQHWLTPVQL